MASSAQYLHPPEERAWNAPSVLAAHDRKALPSPSPSPSPRWQCPETFLGKAMASSNAHPHCMNGPLFSAYDGKEVPSFSCQESQPFLSKAMASLSAHRCTDGIEIEAESANLYRESPALAFLALSAAAFGRARAGKRKSRTSSKIPMRVFSTDAANFMAMVHKLTGLQSNASFSLNEPFNPLISHLPSTPASSTAQGMLSPRFSAIPSADTEGLPKSWPRFFHEISHFIAKGTNVDDDEASATTVSSRWHQAEEHQKNGHLLTDSSHGNSLPHTSITNFWDVGGNMDKDFCRGSSNWDFS